MSTSLRRIAVCLDPEVDRLLVSLSERTGKSQASIVAALLGEAKGGLRGVLAALDAAEESGRSAGAAVRDLLGRLAGSVAQPGLDLRRCGGRPRKT